jgi:phospholipase/lecithinase/hemolysin
LITKSLFGKRQAPKLFCALALAVAALAGCGGGSAIEPFAPKRIAVFGDESNVITSDGRKYTVNALNSTTGAIDCTANPLWVQTLASTFGLVFAECNTGNVAAPTGKIYATVGAKVADVKAQVDGFLATESVNAKTLITVLAGANDILALYAQYPLQSEASLKAQAADRGAQLAQQVNRLVDAGGRLIVPTIPDMGLSPFALAENTSKADPNRSKLLSALSLAFNNSLTLKVTLDGRQLGVVLADEMVQSIVKFPAYYGYGNVVDAACQSSVALPNCTSNTMVTNATVNSWLWATPTLLSPAGQARLGLLAQFRAQNNPF